MSENEVNPNAHEPIDPHAASVLKLANAMFRMSLWPSLATLVLGVVVAWIAVGTTGALGALVGGTIACLSSLLTVFLMRKTATQGPHIVMAASLGGFVGKMLVLLIVMTLLRGVDVLHARSLAFTMIAVVLVAAAADGVAFRRTKIPTIIPAGESPSTR
jgi:ATP synthase protein I